MRGEKMIHIGKPFVKTAADRAYLCAPVEIPDDAAARYLEVTDALANTAWLTKDDYPPAAWIRFIPSRATEEMTLPEERG